MERTQEYMAASGIRFPAAGKEKERLEPLFLNIIHSRVNHLKHKQSHRLT